MIKKLLHQESGYSLPELVVAIMLLSIAILPMVKMFDASFTAATRSGDYDRARALANQKLERAKGIPYTTLRRHFPETAPTETTYNSSGYYESTWRTVSGSQAMDFSGLEFQVAKQFLRQPTLIPSSSSEAFATSGSNEGVIRVTVTVRWGDGNNTYTTSGVVARGSV